MVTPTLDTSYLPPLLPTLVDNNPADAKALYDDTRLELQALTEGGYVTFLETYFPDEPFYPAALEWLRKALVDGGTGVNPAVEAQLFERGRVRLDMEAQRAEETAIQTYAGRGFPLPPGPMLHAQLLIRQDYRDKLAEQSRDITIEAWRAELETIKFAVQQAIDLRLKAIAAAGEYVRVLLEGPKTAMQLATAMVNLRSDFNRNVVQFYTAQVQASEPRVRLAIADADLKSRAGEANLRSRQSSIESRSRLAQASAQMVATAAAASLNGINASASISGSDSTSN